MESRLNLYEVLATNSLNEQNAIMVVATDAVSAISKTRNALQEFDEQCEITSVSIILSNENVII